ncbi:MAG: Xaa-Pro peptidase family protein, partial [Planktomarina sp.]|nr:Xaa-Pro peptidase family protein [Planktomarina sp.]
VPYHFKDCEYEMRLKKATAAVAARGLDALLMFAPESHYWICGYDTFGFAMFQCLILGADGKLNLLTREPDLRQAQQTSTLSDEQIHIWKDVEGVSPASNLCALVSQLGYDRNIAMETKTPGLTFFNGQSVVEAFDQTLMNGDSIISQLRQDKSIGELEMHRRAATLSDDALDAALAATRAGAFEGDILADMQGAVFRGGGDYAGNEFIIGSDQRALLCRYASGRRHLEKQDQMTLEWSGAYARYHAAMMQTLIVGKADQKHRYMHAVALEALEACEVAIKPGQPMGDVFTAHARVLDKAGLVHARLNACGYAMGATYNPIWVDFPMFYEGNATLMHERQVFFLHMILMDSNSGHAMCLGHSVEVIASGAKRLSRHPPDLFEL